MSTNKTTKGQDILRKWKITTDEAIENQTNEEGKKRTVAAAAAAAADDDDDDSEVMVSVKKIGLGNLKPKPVVINKASLYNTDNTEGKEEEEDDENDDGKGDINDDDDDDDEEPSYVPPYDELYATISSTLDGEERIIMFATVTDKLVKMWMNTVRGDRAFDILETIARNIDEARKMTENDREVFIASVQNTSLKLICSPDRRYYCPFVQYVNTENITETWKTNPQRNLLGALLFTNNDTVSTAAVRAFEYIAFAHDKQLKATINVMSEFPLILPRNMHYRAEFTRSLRNYFWTIAEKGSKDNVSHLTKLKVKYPTSSEEESAIYFMLCEITENKWRIHEGSANEYMAKFLILLLGGIESGVVIKYLPEEEHNDYHELQFARMHFGLNLRRLDKVVNMLEKASIHSTEAVLMKEAVKLGRKFIDRWTDKNFQGFHYNESDK